MSPEYMTPFVDRLQWGIPIGVSLAKRGETIKPGLALIAPGGYQTTITPNGTGNKIRLSRKTSDQGISPSIDCVMESAAKVYGDSTLGVLLTGLGNDGVRGLKAIKEAGGITIVQDESTCVVFGMPSVLLIWAALMKYYRCRK
jgi:two-component system chemotaxis response regulator CheB